MKDGIIREILVVACEELEKAQSRTRYQNTLFYRACAWRANVSFSHSGNTGWGALTAESAERGEGEEKRKVRGLDGLWRKLIYEQNPGRSTWRCGR